VKGSALCGFGLSVVLAASAEAGTGMYVVEDAKGYNSWPMIQSIGNRLVCAYSSGSGHSIEEGARGVFTRVSDDGGRTWSARAAVADDPGEGEVTIGKGRDATGAMLLWVRCYGGPKRHHDLYRTTDGVAFTRISSPAFDPLPMQITDIFTSPDGGLMCLWFAGDYSKEPRQSWGTLTSADDGRTWQQRTVESGLLRRDWPTEPSAAVLRDGRILVIARSEDPGQQFQLLSADGGKTWTKRRTNIGDVVQSTPSLVYDPASDRLFNYYFHRGPGALKRRIASAAAVADRPEAWPEPETVAWGNRERAYDSGNANAAVTADGRHFVAYYAGTPTQAKVMVAAVDDRADRLSWTGRRIVFFGDSITDPQHIGCLTNYWGFLSADLPCVAEVYGVNGDRWVGLPKQVERAKKDLPADSVEACFVFLGTNDFNSDQPLGVWETIAFKTVDLNGKPTTLAQRLPVSGGPTVRGAINAGLGAVRRAFPRAQVILLTPIHRGFAQFGPSNVQPDETFARPSGRFLDDYVQVVREAGARWSCPVIDLYSESGLLPNEPEQAAYLAKPDTTDRLHPSTAGHRKIADLIEARLRFIPPGNRP